MTVVGSNNTEKSITVRLVRGSTKYSYDVLAPAGLTPDDFARKVEKIAFNAKSDGPAIRYLFKMGKVIRSSKETR
jgi:hypothetical protein